MSKPTTLNLVSDQDQWQPSDLHEPTWDSILIMVLKILIAADWLLLFPNRQLSARPTQEELEAKHILISE